MSATTTAPATWRAANAAWLCARLERLRLQLQRRALWLRHGMGHDGAVLDRSWLLTAAESAESRFHADHAGAAEINRAVASIDAELDARTATLAGSPPALVHLGDACGLSQFERDVLVLALAPALDASFEHLYAVLHGDPPRPYATLHLALGVFLDTPTARVVETDALAPWRPLRSLDLVHVEGDGVQPLVTRPLTVADRVADYIRGVNRLDQRLTQVLHPIPPPLLTEAQERLVASLVEWIRSSDVWPVVNLVGTADAGGSEVAAGAAAQAGFQVRRVDVAALAALADSEREGILRVLSREAVLMGLGLVVDADAESADTVRHRTVIRDLVDRLGAVLFVVGRERWLTHHPVHVVPVPRPDRAGQRVLWRRALDRTASAVNGELDALTQQFDFGAAAIADAVRVAGQLAEQREDNPVIAAGDLWEACRGRESIELGTLAQRVTPGYGWDDIVISSDALAQLRELASQVEHRAHVYETWGFGRPAAGRAITALFAGASGTGKTMAAEVLAGHLRLDLHRIDLSCVVSKYIGETEKNLRRVFDAAERTGAILFFDEADALFGTRTEVRDSHDRYANIEVNYLLQRMEDYAGLAILATNRRAALDEAFLRRLRFVIEFPFPTVDRRRRIWERVFPSQAALAGIDFAFLAGLELAGGSIRSIAVNAAFLAAADARPIEMRHILRAVRREYAKLERPISVAEFGAYHEAGRP